METARAYIAKRFRIDEYTLLRELTEDDADALYAAVDGNRAHLRAWLAWVDGQQGAADSLKFIQNSAAQIQQGCAFSLGIEHQGEIIGVIGFHEIDQDNQLAAIGYWIAACHQGKGIVTRSCGRLIDYAFDDLKLNKVLMRIAEENRRSRNVAERLGFAQENNSNQSEWLYDHYVDLIIYALRAPSTTHPHPAK